MGKSGVKKVPHALLIVTSSPDWSNLVKRAPGPTAPDRFNGQQGTHTVYWVTTAFVEVGASLRLLPWKHRVYFFPLVSLWRRQQSKGNNGENSN